MLYKKKKLCGILTITKKEKAIVGIGLNTNNKIPKTLESKATSLKKITKNRVDNKKVINKILNHLEKYIKLLKNKKYKKIINDWKKASFLGQRIKVKTTNKTYEGIAYNIDKNCLLVLKDKKGKKIKIIEGDFLLE